MVRGDLRIVLLQNRMQFDDIGPVLGELIGGPITTHHDVFRQKGALPDTSAQQLMQGEVNIHGLNLHLACCPLRLGPR